MPNVVLAYNKFKSKDFTVVGISLDDAKDKKAWINAISADGALWTQLLDANKKVKALYGITTIPANILINPDGKIIARNLKDKTLLIKLDELLGGK
jgi:alkyl hydroperoxide reductase subunit AhpC